MADLPPWALSHLDASLPAGNTVVNARRVRRNLVLANTRLGAVLVKKGLWTGVSHVFLEAPAQKTAFRCAQCHENLQFYNLKMPSDVFCSICASKYHVDAGGQVTDAGGARVPSEFKAKEFDPFPPVHDLAAAVHDLAAAVHDRDGAGRENGRDGSSEGSAPVAVPSGKPYRHGGYTLYARRVETRGGARTLYFFSKGEPKSGSPSPLPDGYAVGSNGRSPLPYLRRAAAPGEAAKAKDGAAAALSPKQLAQRKYAARMKGVRERAGKARGGKGRIAKRRVATRMRRELGLKGA